MRLSARAGRTAAVLLGLWAVTVAFNFTKAVHIDDRAYLDIARHIARHPLHPMSGRLNLFGIDEPLHETNQPPLLFYVYAGVIRCLGESEPALHAVMALFSLVAIVAFHALARRLAPKRAVLLTAMFCLGPAFLPGQNLMTDVPVMALWLVFFTLLIPPEAGGLTVRRAALAAVIASAACLIKYVSLVLIPILLVALLLRRRRRAAWVVLIPVGVLAAWSACNVMEYGTAHLLSRPTTKLFASSLAVSCEEWLIGLGAVCPFSVAALPFLRRSRRARMMIAACALASCLSLAWGVLRMPEPIWYSLLRAAFVGSGALVCCATASCLVDALRPLADGEPPEARRDLAVVALWLVGAAAFVILLAPFMAVRHLLLAIPAILLVLGRYVLGEVRRGWRVSAVLGTVALGLLLAASDWRFADCYRASAPRIARRYAGDRTVWFVGHWGWQWYAEKAGMEPYYQSESILKPGDVLVVPSLVPRYGIMNDLPERLVKVEEVVVRPTPATLVRTMATWPRWSGYYAYHSGGLPWIVSRMPLEKFVVYVVREGGD